MRIGTNNVSINSTDLDYDDCMAAAALNDVGAAGNGTDEQKAFHSEAARLWRIAAIIKASPSLASLVEQITAYADKLDKRVAELLATQAVFDAEASTWNMGSDSASTADVLATIAKDLRAMIGGIVS